MLNERKVNQVISAINENDGIKAFDDNSLASLLSILNKNEYDMLENRAFSELGGTKAYVRIVAVKPLVENYVMKDLYRIKTSNLYKSFIDSIVNGRYQEYFSTLNSKELADLIKYLSYPADKNKTALVSGFDKVIRMLTDEVKHRDEKSTHQFG